MQVKSIAEVGEHSAILLTSLSYHLSLRSLFCLLLSGRFTQVLLYLSDVMLAFIQVNKLLERNIENIFLSNSFKSLRLFY